MMILMLAPGPDLVFGGAPSGTVYQSNNYGLIYVVSGSAADQLFLQGAGCQTLTPYGYAPPPNTRWKLGCTGCGVLAVLTGTASMNVMSCVVHRAVTTLAGAVKVTLGNWFSTNNVGDYWGPVGGNFMGPLTVKGSICYPGPNDVIGVFGPITIPEGQNIDVIVPLLAPIPAGALFYEGEFAAPTSGCQVPVCSLNYYPSGLGPYPTNSVAVNTALGEGSWASVSATDLTASLSTISGNASYNGFKYRALAISAVLPVTTSVLATLTDSLHAGFKGGSDAFNNLGPFAWAFGDGVAVLDLAVSGQAAAANVGGGFAGTGYASAMQMREDTMARCGVTHVLAAEGADDVLANSSGATIEAALTYIWNELSALGYAVWTATLPPITTSTDNWATTTNQTVIADESARTNLNTFIRSKPLPLAGFIEFCAAVESAPGSGLWTPRWTDDGVHWFWPATLAAAGAVPVTAFRGFVPAFTIAYADTFGLGVKSDQTAIDRLLGQAGATGVTTLAPADHTFAPYLDGKTIRDNVALTGDQKLILAVAKGPIPVPDGYSVKLSRAGSSGGHSRKVYQSDGSTLVLSVADGAFASFTYSAAAAAWFQSG